MKNSNFVLLLDGSPGSGKTEILNDIRTNFSDSFVVGRKLTTRPKRSNDNDWELQFVANLEKNNNKFSYTAFKHTYAINSNEIDETLQAGKNYAIIIGDIPTIKKLKQKYQVVLVFVYRNISRQTLKELLDDRGIKSQEEIRGCAQSLQRYERKYLINLGEYNHVILNVDTIDFMLDQIRTIIRLELYKNL